MVHKVKVKIPEAKFKVGEKVIVYDDEGALGVGRITIREFMWHPEHWGAGRKPKWAYMVKNTRDNEGEDVEGLWSESALGKFKKGEF